VESNPAINDPLSVAGLRRKKAVPDQLSANEVIANLTAIDILNPNRTERYPLSGRPKPPAPRPAQDRDRYDNRRVPSHDEPRPTKKPAARGARKSKGLTKQAVLDQLHQREAELTALRSQIDHQPPPPPPASQYHQPAPPSQHHQPPPPPASQYHQPLPPPASQYYQSQTSYGGTQHHGEYHDPYTGWAPEGQVIYSQVPPPSNQQAQAFPQMLPPPKPQGHFSGIGTISHHEAWGNSGNSFMNAGGGMGVETGQSRYTSVPPPRLAPTAGLFTQASPLGGAGTVNNLGAANLQWQQQYQGPSDR
jgi:hypothetical protein